nr:hypothetical protein CFP56_33770 [Quercus suber]
MCQPSHLFVIACPRCCRVTRISHYVCTVLTPINARRAAREQSTAGRSSWNGTKRPFNLSFAFQKTPARRLRSMNEYRNVSFIFIISLLSSTRKPTAVRVLGCNASPTYREISAIGRRTSGR